MSGSKTSRWEAFAQADAEYYILTEIGDSSTPDARRRFFDSGRRKAEEIYAAVKAELPGRGRAIEIGCGVGRLLLPMAGHFGSVTGVDIAPTMLDKLAGNARELGAGNVRGMLAHEAWDEPACADLVYSFIVFQHIEDFGEISRYVERAAKALRPGGVAFLQFDTRPAGFGYRLRNALPDALLPRPWRRGIRRMRRDPVVLGELFARCGLKIVRELAAKTELHVFVLKKERA